MKSASSRGSVLMEFVIVLPLYFVLLGMLFLYGDLSLHAIDMAASGDRTFAVLHGDYSSDEEMADVESAVKGALSASSNREEAVVRYTDGASDVKESASLQNVKSAGLVADTGFRGSWTWLVGSTLTDEYALVPVSRSFARAWKVFADAARMSAPEWETMREYDEGSVLQKLFPSSAATSFSVGRVSMTSKDLEGGGAVRAYAYYTLKRNAYGRNSYRAWGAGALVDGNGRVTEGSGGATGSGATWAQSVFGEEYFFDGHSADELVDENRGGTAAAGGDRGKYTRFPRFADWTN